MLVILTIFYFCSLYLRFNKNLPAIHCHFLCKRLLCLICATVRLRAVTCVTFALQSGRSAFWERSAIGAECDEALDLVFLC